MQHATQHWRTFELACHALMQCAFELRLPLPILQQPRRPLRIKAGNSSDKKAGDIGDVQIAHEDYRDVRGQRYIQYALDSKLSESGNPFDVSSDLIDVASRWSDAVVPQNRLQVFEWIGREVPFLSNNPTALEARNLLERNGVALRFSTLLSLADDLQMNDITLWLDRYTQILCKTDLMQQDYGVPTENTTPWVVSLIESIEMLQVDLD